MADGRTVMINPQNILSIEITASENSLDKKINAGWVLGQVGRSYA